ncbi:MAG: ABC transporter ATP-binding protein [Bryobacteraceae bacterium]|nr:ABC transporter ATP-binding protein [Bryobacteraceae bacterium]
MLETRALSKSYSRIPAVQNVSFTVKPGQVLGYLGPNGSGKSTTVRMLTGLLEPTSGEVLFHGVSIRTDLVNYKRRIGYVPEEAHLYPHLTGLEYLELVGTLRDLDERTLRTRAQRFLQLFGLTHATDSPVSAYSKGMRQRLLLTAALLHDPELLIFDEPESGLDVGTTLVFRKLVAELARNGKMVLYCSHVLEAVEKVCSHVLVLHRGKVVAHESIEGMRSLTASPSLEAVFSELTQQADSDEAARSLVAAMKLQ